MGIGGSPAPDLTFFGSSHSLALVFFFATMRVIRAVAALNSGRLAASRQSVRYFSLGYRAGVDSVCPSPRQTTSQIGACRPFSGTRSPRYAALTAAEEA